MKEKSFRIKMFYYIKFRKSAAETGSEFSALHTSKPPWRNRLARSAVNRKVGGSSPPGGVIFLTEYDRKNLLKILTLAGLEPAIP